MRWLLWRNVVLVLFAVLQIYECKKADPENPPRSVNLALETVLEFDNYENSADIKIIDKVQTFLNKVKTVIEKNKGFRRAGGDEGPLSFTDFVKSVLVILTSYSDDDLEQIAAVADEELRKYHYKGCKFYELVENDHLRRFMADQLQEIKTRSGKQLKKQLKAIIKKLTDENRGFKHKLISRYLDSLYTEEDGKAFNKFLRHMALYRRETKRTHMDINKIIKHGLRRIIFDHYSNLDVDTRRDLKLKLETFWKDSSSNVGHHVWKLESKPISKLKILDSEASKQERDLETKAKIVKKEASKQGTELETPKPKTKPKHKKKKKRVKKIKTTTEKDEELYTPERVTKPPRLTFITLYPEAITMPKKRHKKTHRKHKRIRPTTLVDSRRVTLLINGDPKERYLPTSDNSKESKLKEIIPIIKKPKQNLRMNKKIKEIFPINKQVISDVKFMIDVEGVNMKSGDARKDVRLFDSSGSNEAKPTEPYKNLKTKVFTFKKDLDLGESDEGLAIDVVQNSDGETPRHEGRPIRKSNTNDTLTLKPVIKTTTTDAAVATEDFIKRIKQLETELKDVKKHLVKTKEHKKDKKHLVKEEEEEEEEEVKHKGHLVKKKNHSAKRMEHSTKEKEDSVENKQVWPSTHKFVEETHFDVLEFWERTKSPPITSSKAKTKKTSTSTTTTASTIDSGELSTSKPETTKKKNHHHHKKKPSETTIATTIETTTEATTKLQPPIKPIPAIFRSADGEVEENNEVIPKTTTKSTKPRHERVDLKSRSTKTLNETTKPTHITTTTELQNLNITATEAVKTSIKEVEVEPEIEAIYRSKVDAYLNETELVEDDDKAKKVKQKIMEDLRQILPDDPNLELIQTERNQKHLEQTMRTEPLSVDKLGSTNDALEILEDDEALKKK